MIRHIISMAIKSIGYAIIMTIVLFPMPYTAADETGTSEPVLEITKVPDFELDSEELLQARHRRFQVQGPLDAIYDDRVVVGDTTIFIDKDCAMNGVRAGDYVGVGLGKNKRALEIMPIEAP